MGPLHPLREQGGGDGAPGSKARRPRALRVLPPGQGGHVGIPAALSPSVGFSFLSQLAECLPLPTHGQPGTSFFRDLSLGLRVPVPLQTRNALSSPISARSVPDSAPGVGGLPTSATAGHSVPTRAPRSPTRPSDRTQPCGLPRLVPPSPQLQPARRSPALPRSLPLGPGSDTTESWSRGGLNVRLSSGGVHPQHRLAPRSRQPGLRALSPGSSPSRPSPLLGQVPPARGPPAGPRRSPQVRPPRPLTPFSRFPGLGPQQPHRGRPSSPSLGAGNSSNGSSGSRSRGRRRGGAAREAAMGLAVRLDRRRAALGPLAAHSVPRGRRRGRGRGSGRGRARAAGGWGHMPA